MLEQTAEQIETYEAPQGTLLYRFKRGQEEQRMLYFRGFTALLVTSPYKREVQLSRDGKDFPVSQADIEVLLQQLKEMV